MNKIWFIMIISSICILLASNPGSILSSMTSSAQESLTLSIELTAVYTVWLGILELIDASGLSEKLAKLLHPIIKKLFNVDDKETEKLIALNMSANILGLGNAATPMGIAAMKRLDDKSGVATHSIIMLIVLNATSLQLLPTTIIGLRTSAGSLSASDIILPTIISTLATCILGIILVKIFNKIHTNIKRRK